MAELFSGPLMSIALVILAGIALRYALWMGRDRDAEAGSGNSELAERNSQLDATIAKLTENERQLRAENSRLNEDYQSLRKALEERGAAGEPADITAEVEMATGRLKRELADLQSSVQSIEEDRDAAVAQIADSEGRGAALLQQVEELRHELRQQKDDRQGLLQLKDQLQNEHVDILELSSNLTTERDRLAVDRVQLAAQVDELTQRCEVLEQQREELAASRDSVGSELVTLRLSAESDRDGLVERCKSAEIERAEMEAQYQVAEKQRVEQLARYEVLKSEQDKLTTERSELIVERDELKIACRSVEDRCRTLEEQCRQYESSSLAAEQRKSDIAKERDALSLKLQHELNRAANSESQRLQADSMQVQLRTDLETTAAQYEATMAERNAMQRSLRESEDRLTEMAAAHEVQLSALADELKAAKEREQESVTQLSEISSRTDSTDQALEAARHEIACMQSEVRFVTQLRSERTTLLSEVKSLQTELESIQAAHAQELAATREQESSQRQILQTELESVRQMLNQHAEKSQLESQSLAERDRQLEAAAAQQSQLEDQIRSISNKLQQHDEIVGEQDDRIANLHVEKDELTHGLRREQEAVQQLTAELEELRRGSRKMELEVSHLELLRQDHRCVSEELADAVEALTEVRSERDALAASVDSNRSATMAAEQRAAQLERDHAAQDKIAGELRDDNQRLQFELARLRTEKGTLENLLSVHAGTLQRLRADSLSIETLLERQASVQESLQQHADRLRSVALDEAVENPDSRSRTTAEMDGVAIGLANVADQDRPTYPEEPHEILAFAGSGESPATPRVDSLLGLVYDHAPSNRDDLTQISGVGAVLEHKLNRLGIYRFEQVMNLRREAVDELSRLLAFRDRIDRDDWIGQARKLNHQQDNQVA